MEDGQDSSGSVDEVAWETDTELYQFALEGAELEYIELIEERLIWTSDLESLKKFVESCLQQQGKWTSPGGNTKQFKSCNNKLVITWYNKKQHTLVFQGQDGPVLKEKLVKIVQDKLETKTDSPDRSTSHDEIKQTTDAEVDSVLEDSLLAEVNDIKHNLMVLKKQVEENTRLLSRNPQNQENITNKELRKQKERYEKLQATLGNKDMEINELKLKIASLETRASSAEQENDSLRLALKIIMQEKSEGECQLQDNQIHDVTVPYRNSKSAAERQCQRNRNRKGKENLKRGTIALQNRFQVLENTLETTTDKSNAEDGDRDDNPTCLTIIAGCTTKDMRDHIKPIIKKNLISSSFMSAQTAFGIVKVQLPVQRKLDANMHANRYIRKQQKHIL